MNNSNDSMLFVTFLFSIFYIGPVVCSSPCSNVGTCLFSSTQNLSRCWTTNELAKLRARQVFEQIIPPQLSPDKINSKYVRKILKYFRRAMREIKDRYDDAETQEILRDSLADTVGAHLRAKILPAVRLSYYAGYVRCRDVRALHDFYDELKCMLDTQGLGWKRPAKIPEWSNLTVAKLLIGSGRIFRPCRLLNVLNDSNSCFHLPEPQLDDNAKPSAILLPFKDMKLISLNSPLSENILVKYYLTAARCILDSSPQKCRHTDFVNFNNEVWHWMKRDVAPHLIDENLYSAFGGVLRVAAAVQSYGKDLKRRYLEYTLPPEEEIKQPNLWEKLTEPTIQMNSQLEAKYYIAIVIVAAVAICMLQICYNYMFGDALGCHCSGVKPKSKKNENTKPDQNPNCNEEPYRKDAQALTVEVTSVCPQMEDEWRPASLLSSPHKRSASARSTRTQRVFDLNDNKEKFMAIVMSEFEKESDTSRQSANSGNETESPCPTIRSNSPPKLETPISQLMISKTSLSKSRTNNIPESTSNMYSSDVTCKRANGSTSGSPSSSTVSASSVSSQGRLTKSSRDIAWARRMITRKSLKSMLKNRVRSGTEDYTCTSCTTPRSRR